MTWPEVRSILPDQWLVIEAVEAYTAEDDRRIIPVMAVYECCVDGGVAWQSAHRLRHQFPGREFYPVHTSQEIPPIYEDRRLRIPPRPARKAIKSEGNPDLLQSGKEYEAWSPYDAIEVAERLLQMLKSAVK